MASILYKNNCVSTLKEGIDERTSSFYITSNDGTFPRIATNSGDFFIATITNPATNEFEIVKVIDCNPSTGYINCIRGYESTSKFSFPKDSAFEIRITAGFFKQLVGNVAAIPFFAWRMESPSNLPEGWIALDGAIYSKTSAIGKALSLIPVNVRNNWNFKETDSSMQVPNFYGFSSTGLITSHADRSVGRVTYIDAKIQDDDTKQNIVARIHMTPAIYIGI